MPGLNGYEHNISPEKLAFDEQFRDVLWPVVEPAIHVGLMAVRGQFAPGTDPFYAHKVIGPDGNYLVYKSRMMHGEGPSADGLDDPTLSDQALAFSKDNPRIVSRTAKLVRASRIDDLPQWLQLGDEISTVGPRPFSTDFLEYFLTQVGRTDRGVARAFEELYFYRGMRHGLTGPGQLRGMWHDKRDDKVAYKWAKADVNYYPEKATQSRDERLIVYTAALIGPCAVAHVGKKLASPVKRAALLPFAPRRNPVTETEVEHGAPAFSEA